MGNFNSRGGAGSKPYGKPAYGGGGRGGYGGNAGGGSRGGFGGPRRDEGGEREMHTATCAECRQECQVPFRPNGTKPVYCSNCFKRDEAPRYGGSENNGVSERPRFDRGDREERPRFEKPAFAPTRAAAPAAASVDLSQFKVQLDIIHSKLDRILKLVSPTVVIEPVAEVVEEKVAAKPKTKKKVVAAE